ncbi:Hypothetical predicted protein [Pelobates cultripes]|uniref:Helix-turn-helix domain-containing protein n=1 Tax=Pelobates cultripes TaxID=61616 RepID=A0AAD1TGW3_PELCU|nr:Hypothetical predicted protein [Pelobates cultripes]
MAPMYANSYMYIFKQEHILSQFHESILFYRRFIDDIMIIWNNVGPTPNQMLEIINNLDTSVRLTMTTSEEQIDFLDVRVYKEDGKIAYTLFNKLTDRNTLLHAESHHPRHLINSLPQSQFMRVIRNNSNVANIKIQLQTMWDKFLARGYNPRNLSKALDRCYETPVQRTDTRERLVFPVTYTTISDNIKQPVDRNWRILQNDTSLPSQFKQRPMMCYQRGSNLRDLLVKTDPTHCYSQPTTYQNAGCYRCLGCVTCSHMIPSKSFTHPHTGKKYLIRHRLTCTSEYVIYKLGCPCGLAYVWKTELPLHEKIRNYRLSIRIAYRDKGSELPVAKHFLEFNHPLPTMKFLAIDHIPQPLRGGDRKKLLLRRELYWIRTLDTLQPRGLNKKYTLGVFL